MGMQDLEPHLDWPGSRWHMGRSRARLIGEFHTPFQSFARIRKPTLHLRPLGHTCAPTLPRATWATLLRHPRPTVRLHPHQDGLAMQEDCIQTHHQDPPLTELIAYRQQRRSLSARLGHPAPHCGPTRDSPVRETKGQQRDDRSQAQAHGGTRGCTRVLLGLGQRLRTGPGFPQRLVFSTQARISRPQRLVTAIASGRS